MIFKELVNESSLIISADRASAQQSMRLSTVIIIFLSVNLKEYSDVAIKPTG